MQHPKITGAESRRIGQQIANLRRERELTQEALAEKVGVASRYLQRVEAGTRSPSLALLATLKRALRVNWSDIFDNV